MRGLKQISSAWGESYADLKHLLGVEDASYLEHDPGESGALESDTIWDDAQHMYVASGDYSGYHPQSFAAIVLKKALAAAGATLDVLVG